MTSNPVTVLDFRKLLLDRLEDLENIWLYPLELPENVAGYSGLYDVSVQPDAERLSSDYVHSLIRSIFGAVKFTGTLDEYFRMKILEVLHANRNLCEDYLPVRVLQPMMISVHGDVHIRQDHNPENVLGEIIFAINNYFSGKIPRHSLKDLLDNGYPVEEIFLGPKLNSGYIIDQDLKHKLDELSLSKINKLIMEVDGVEGVKDLKWGGENSHGLISVDRYSYPELQYHEENAEGAFTIKIFKKQLRI